MALKFRRGTTAQKSGSLQFGEPYINTDLQTLQIGTDLGDVTLSTASPSAAFQGASVSASTFISGASLDITGNANIHGDLTLGGKLTIGDQTSDTVNVVASLSSSLIPQTTNAFDLGSADKIWRDLYISTGSIKFVEGTSVVKTLNLNTLTALETATGSSNTSIANLNTTTASLNTSVSNLNSFTSSQLTQNSALATITGSLISSASTAKTTNDSQDISITNLNATTASLNTSVSNINSFTSSQLIQNSALATITGSLITTASNLTQRVAANEAVSGTYARTNASNTFVGNQTITGSLYVTVDLVVQGSSYLKNITASAVSIGTNTVVLNTASPAVRYGGIQVVDSGSSASTGSLLWDSENNVWIYVNPSGAAYTSARLIAGPQSATIGSEPSLIAGRVPTISGDDHISSSHLVVDNTTLSVNNIDVTGSIKAAQLTAIGTITGSLITTASANVVSVANLNSFTSSQLTQNSTLATYTGSVEGRFTTLATTSGSLQTSVSNLNTTTASLNTSVSNINTFTASMSTTSNVRFGSLGIGMAASGTSGRIDAANDIVAYSSSDIRFKENITPIENAIDKIRKISGNTYDWKAENKELHGYEGNDVGVIAQEIEAVLPQLVQNRDNGYKAVKYDKLVALLIEGIKEQQLQIEKLQLEVSELKKQKGL
jgi:hypothetical protein